MPSTWPGVQRHEPPLHWNKRPPHRVSCSPQRGPLTHDLMPPSSIVLRPVGFIGPCTHLPPKWREGKERDNLPYAKGARAHTNTRAPHARHIHLINLSSLCFPSPIRGSFVSLWPKWVERCQGPLPVNWIVAVAPPTLCFSLVFNMTYWPVHAHSRFVRDGLYLFHPSATQLPPRIRPVLFPAHPKSKASYLAPISLSNTHTQVAFVYARQQMAAHYWADRVVIWHAPCHPLHPHPTLRPSPSWRHPTLEQQGGVLLGGRVRSAPCVRTRAHARVCRFGLWPFCPM